MYWLWFVPSIVILAALAAGVALARLEIPDGGFFLFLFGLFLSALALPILGGAAAFASATGRAWRGGAVRAAAVPLVTVLSLALPGLSRLNPPIHDITTDPDDTLAFSGPVAELRPALEGEMPREVVLEQQRGAYADLAPLQTPLPPARAFSAALEAARAMPGWQVTGEDAAAGRIEAVATTRLFRFRDDVVIRVQAGPQEQGSRIDVRSRSRVGQSDLGANAERIREFLARVREVQAGS